MSSQNSNPPVNHGSTESINGRNPTIPAVPSANSNGLANEHKRTPSMTVTPAGATTYNANGAPQNKSNIQFGSVNGGNPSPSPAMATPTMAHQASASLGVNSLNPRMASPSSSPSPIPQPVQASGGRPPSGMQGPGSAVNFGQFGGDTPDANGMTRSMSQMQLGDHRRGSSQSIHGDMNGPGLPTGPGGRGGYPPQGGRGRGSFSGNYQNQMAYSPGANFRPHNGRGGYTPRGNHAIPYQGSPSLQPRQPMMNNPANPHGGHMQMMPGMPAQQYGYQYPVNTPFPTPHFAARGNPKGSVRGRGGRKNRDGSKQSGRPLMPSRDPASDSYVPPPQSVPLVGPIPYPVFPLPDLSPESGNFEHFLTSNQGYGGVPIQADPSISYNYNQQFYPQQPGFNPYAGPPQSPRPQFQGPYGAPMQHTYSGQGAVPTQMSRQSSQISNIERPSSSIGQTPQTPASAPHHPSARTPSVSGDKAFSLPQKQTKKIVIKNANGEVVDFSKPPSSPAPTNATAPTQSSTPAVQTPPSRTGSAVDPQTRSEPQVPVAKNDEDKKKAMQEAVARRIAEEKEQEAEKVRKQKEADDEKIRMEQEAVQAAEREAAAKKEEAEKAEREAKEAEEAKAKADAAPAPEDEEDEFERMAREMEEEAAKQEEAEAKAEAEYLAKKAAKKEAEAKAKQEEEARYYATLKEAEREAEERELALEKKRAGGAADDDESKKLFASLKGETATGSGDDSGVPTPDESGAATPISETSMGPPAKSIGPSKRGRAAELTLDTKKPVEPAEPSATLKSLTTAKRLQDPSSVSYPSGFVSPNPALNANAPADKKFKYNKEFLLQFQNVFKEKPSLDWDQRVRETLGDGDSARPQTARTPSGMGGRNPSHRQGANTGFTPMGAFGGSGTMGRGSTSEQRFAASNAAGRGGAMGNNPFAAFGRPGSMGAPMGRQPSNNPMGGVPSSPRVGGSHRGTRNESKRTNKHNKQEQGDNKAMPLTAGMQIGTLETTATGWKPRSVGQNNANNSTVGLDGYMEADVVQRKVKAALNKMTPENFDRISGQILEIAAQSKQETDGRTLRQVIQLVFEKATDEAHWAPMYAKFCYTMLSTMSNDVKDETFKDKAGNVVTGGNLFRKYLLNRCQEEFERGWKVNLPEKPEGVSDEAAMLSDEYYIAAAAKRRGLGLVRFIGELFKLGMLTERIMNECLKKLLDYEGYPDEAEVESLSSLLRTIGKALDSPESRVGKERMDAYFNRINQTMALPELASRLKFMLMDIVDLRRNGWVSKDADKGPKTIQEIHEEAEAKRAADEMQRLASQANRGGGRMAVGRGDARSFSSGYGQVPPPDTSNRIGADDLRRLGGRAQRNTTTPSGSFGPSGLGARTNSGRRGLGPNLNRPDDSNASSRTGTPPASKDKDKKDESSTNAFSALAALDGHDGPTSPPSNPSSPPTQNSQPIDRERSRSPEKKAE